jgi:hypothetical protein
MGKIMISNERSMGKIMISNENQSRTTFFREILKIRRTTAINLPAQLVQLLPGFVSLGPY